MNQMKAVAMIIEIKHEPDSATAGIGYLSVVELTEKYRAGELTPAEVVETLLRRIEEIDSEGGVELNAVIEVSETVLGEVEALNVPTDQALWGVPIIIKDNIEVAGWPSGAGSCNFDLPASDDADLIRELREAGALLLSNANLTEWAAAASQSLQEGESRRGGLTGNPWALDRSAGSSSSGSAASVAAGFAPVAIGTETIGSLCQPASHCGVFAMKATRNAISTKGLIPYSATQDVPGVFARELEDIRLVMSTLLHKDLYYPDDVRICFGRDKDLSDASQSDYQLQSAFQELSEALSDAGFAGTDIPRIDEPEYARMQRVLNAELVRDLDPYLAQRPGSAWKSLAASLYLELVSLTCGAEPRQVFPDGFEEALEQSPIDIEQERDEMERYFTGLLEKMLGSDEVIAAVAYGPAEKLDLSTGLKRRGYRYHSFLDGISSAVGWPALTIPFTEVNNMPVGLILVARPHEEEKLLGAAKWLQVKNLAGRFERPNWTAPRRG